mmetsp:Transcript_35166/g.65502  ORF Transcript_35166/g.65502 Transcript_35166/m.65502 type:complete len:136 (-) Transcript_35166:163-570(-)
MSSHGPLISTQALTRQLPSAAFNRLAVHQSIFGMPSMANGLGVRELLNEVGRALADAEVKSHRVMGLTDSQRVRMFTEKALDNIQHARELHAQVDDSVANIGIGVPREEEEMAPWILALLPTPLSSRRRSWRSFL